MLLWYLCLPRNCDPLNSIRHTRFTPPTHLHHLIVITANLRELENMEDASVYDSSEGASAGHTNQDICGFSNNRVFCWRRSCLMLFLYCLLAVIFITGKLLAYILFLIVSLCNVLLHYSKSLFIFAQRKPRSLVWSWLLFLLLGNCWHIYCS